MTNKFIDVPRAFSWNAHYDKAFINSLSEKVIYTVNDFVFLTDLENHEIDRALLESRKLIDVVKKEFANSLEKLDDNPENWEEAMLVMDATWV